MSATEHQTATKERKFNLGTDEARHKRVKLAAINLGVTARELTDHLIDIALPKVESGELKIQKSTPR